MELHRCWVLPYGCDTKKKFKGYATRLFSDQMGYVCNGSLCGDDLPKVGLLDKHLISNFGNGRPYYLCNKAKGWRHNEVLAVFWFRGLKTMAGYLFWNAHIKPGLFWHVHVSFRMHWLISNLGDLSIRKLWGISGPLCKVGVSIRPFRSQIVRSFSSIMGVANWEWDLWWLSLFCESVQWELICPFSNWKTPMFPLWKGCTAWFWFFGLDICYGITLIIL